MTEDHLCLFSLVIFPQLSDYESDYSHIYGRLPLPYGRFRQYPSPSHPSSRQMYVSEWEWENPETHSTPPTSSCELQVIPPLKTRHCWVLLLSPASLVKLCPGSPGRWTETRREKTFVIRLSATSSRVLFKFISMPSLYNLLIVIIWKCMPL